MNCGAVEVGIFCWGASGDGLFLSGDGWCGGAPRFLLCSAMTWLKVRGGRLKVAGALVVVVCCCEGGKLAAG